MRRPLRVLAAAASVVAAAAAAAASASAAAAAAAAAPASVVSLSLDWPSFLSRADPSWNWTAANRTGRPDGWTRSLYGGNAMLGFLLWHDGGDGDDSVRIAVSRADTYDDRTAASTPAAYTDNFVYDRPRLPIGSLRVSFASGQRVAAGATGRIVLHGARAEYNLTTPSGGAVALRVWACADADAADAIVVEAQGSGGERAVVTWEPALAQSTWSGRSASYVPNPPPRNASAPAPGGSGTLNVTTQLHLRGTAHSTAVWQGAGGAGGGDALLTIVSTSAVLASGAAAGAWASAQVLKAQAAGAEALRARHEAWWAAFWPQGGSLFLDYSVIEQLFYVMLYKFGSAARRGRAFMDLMGPWFIDDTNAPDVHWDWNIQGLYYLPFASGRFDIAGSLVDYMQGLAESGVLSAPSNVPVGWEDSAAAPAGASALDGVMSCYWEVGPNCTSAPPTVTGNLLWVLQLLQQTAAYSANATAEARVVFPLLGKAIRFYSHFVVDNGTVISLPTTFSPEYPARGPNTNYDIALLRWAVAYALELDARLNASSPDAPMWRDYAARLVHFQVDAASDTFAIFEGQPLTCAHRHFSHLLMIWPLHTLDLTDAALRERATRSVDLWSSMPELDSLFGRPACMAMNTLLGRPAAALDNLTFMLHTRIEGSGWYQEGGQTVCNEAPFMAAFAIVDALLQSWNTTALVPGAAPAPHVLEFFPFVSPLTRLDGSAYEAAPAKLATAAFFRLPAEGGFLASAQRREYTDGRCGANVLCTFTAWVAVELGAGVAAGASPPLVIRVADMPRPLAVYPEGAAALTELGDGGLVLVALAPSTTGVVVYSGSVDPPEFFAVEPRVGCPAQYNFFGGGNIMQPESVGAPPPSPSGGAGTPVVLRNCSVGADGLAAPGQRFVYNATGLLDFALQDGTGRCLSLDSCAGGQGANAVLIACGGGAGPSAPAPLGCEGGAGGAPSCFGATQAWALGDASGSPPGFVKSAPEGQCLELHGGADPDAIDVWGCQTNGVRNMEWAWNATSGALASLATCCAGTCLTATG